MSHMPVIDIPAVNTRDWSCSVVQRVIRFLEPILPLTAGTGHPELGFAYQG